MAQPARPAPGRRRWTLVLAALGLLLAAGAFSLSRLLEPERLGAFVLEQAAAATGLELTVSRPADVGLWPDLHVEMAGLSARAPDEEQPLFTAEGVHLVLPWSSLTDRVPVVQRLRLIAPVVHRPALARWLASRPQQDPSQPFDLPELTAGLDIERGALLGEGPDQWALQDLAISTSALHEGQPFTATVSGTLHLDDAQHALRLELQTTPRQQQGLLLEPLALSLATADIEAPLGLAGRLQWQPPERLGFRLAGTLAEWPPQWPALPLEGVPPLELALAYDGPPALSGRIDLDASGKDASLQAGARLADLLQWLQSPDGTPLPPASARLSAARATLGTTVLQQLEVQLEDAPAVEEAPQP